MTGIESEERIGYKIVRLIPCLFGKRRFFSYNIASPSKVEYFINKWAYPNFGCGVLAVFETKESAIEFLKEDYKYSEDYRYISLFRCKYTSSNEPMFYKYGEFCFFAFASVIPKGTEKASRVMLLEEIDLHKKVEENEKE